MKTRAQALHTLLTFAVLGAVAACSDDAAAPEVYVQGTVAWTYDGGAADVKKGTNYLSDLEIDSAFNGWGPLEKDQSNGEAQAGDGQVLTIGAKRYNKGLGVHPADERRAEVEYDLGGQCDTFSAEVGLDNEIDEQSAHGSVVFEVYGDSERLWTSERLTGQDDAVATGGLDIGGVGKLELLVTNAGDNNFYDHADWGDAKVACEPEGSEVQTTRYTPTAENFPNPERGLPLRVDPPWPQDAQGNYISQEALPWAFCGGESDPALYDYTALTEALDADELREGRAQGSTLMMVRYHLAAFRSRELSEEFLDRLESDFATARDAGVKLVPRFAYNYPKGGPDAPLRWVLLHLDQLQPVLENNEDVLAFMDFGFIGCWGEMHTSSNDLISSDSRLNDATRQIIERVFQTVPQTRMVAVRYPSHKFQYFNGPSGDLQIESTPSAPLTEAEAFSGSIKSRWAHHDDCIACGEWNAGTYRTPHSSAEGRSKPVLAFLEQDNEYLVQSGEVGATCCTLPENPVDEDGDGWLSDYEACERVTPLFERLHYSTFNHNDDPERIARWKREGCFDEIAKRLGYRFFLVEGAAVKEVAPGQPLHTRLTVRNEGWARPYNPRGLELILRERRTGRETRLAFDTPEDVRLLLPGPGETEVLDLSFVVPDALAKGTYDLFLNLPDPAPALYKRPEYSIRLANKDIWEADTGYNALGLSTQIK